MYSINCLTEWIEKWKDNNWIGSKNQSILNLDIIKPTYELIKKYENQIIFKHVVAHTKNMDFESIGNSIADDLARKSV